MKNPLIWVILAVVLVGGYFAFMAMSDESPSGSEEAAAPVESNDTSSDAAPVSAYTVKYTDTGFSPESLSVPLGTTVTFINQSSGDMWVGSDEHPSHTGYDGTSRAEHCAAGAAPSFDQCATGSTYSFTFEKAGTFEYHNHRNAQAHGVIVVTP